MAELELYFVLVHLRSPVDGKLKLRLKVDSYVVQCLLHVQMLSRVLTSAPNQFKTVLLCKCVCNVFLLHPNSPNAVVVECSVVVTNIVSVSARQT